MMNVLWSLTFVMYAMIPAEVSPYSRRAKFSFTKPEDPQMHHGSRNAKFFQAFTVPARPVSSTPTLNCAMVKWHLPKEKEKPWKTQENKFMGQNELQWFRETPPGRIWKNLCLTELLNHEKKKSKKCFKSFHGAHPVYACNLQKRASCLIRILLSESNMLQY